MLIFLLIIAATLAHTHNSFAKRLLASLCFQSLWQLHYATLKKVLFSFTLWKKGGLGDRISEQCAIWLFVFLILLMFRIAIHHCDCHFLVFFVAGTFGGKMVLAGKMLLVGKMEERATWCDVMTWHGLASPRLASPRWGQRVLWQNIMLENTNQ